MQRIIIADTSCIIILNKIDRLELLHQLFGTIVITKEIEEEFGEPLPKWFSIESPTDKNYQTVIQTMIDKGEASAIALALSYNDSLIIIDDLKGRQLASQLGIKTTGTLGVLLDAKAKGYLKTLLPVIETIQKNTNFRLSDQLVKKVLELAGE